MQGGARPRARVAVAPVHRTPAATAGRPRRAGEAPRRRGGQACAEHCQRAARASVARVQHSERSNKKIKTATSTDPLPVDVAVAPRLPD